MEVVISLLPVLGSSRWLLTSGSGGETGMVFVVSQDAAGASAAEFEFPGIVAMEFKLDAAEFELAVEKMVFITMVGGAV